MNDLKNGSQHPKQYWDAVRDLKRGISDTKPSQKTIFLNSEGVERKTAAENEETVQAHFTKVFNIPSSCQTSVINEIRQRKIRHFLDDAPSDDEIRNAVLHAKHGKACGDSGIAAEFWQVLEDRPETSKLLHEYINDCWTSCQCSAEWLESRLKILYKGKGDARDLNNWRGIMLIEAAAKIVCSILGNRIQNFLNAAGLEEQNGFTPGRGGLDGIFSLKVALQKRREHGLDTWAVFIDLIKAFDSVPCSLFWRDLDFLPNSANLFGSSTQASA